MAVRVYFPPVVKPTELAALLFKSLVVVFVNFQKSLVVALEGVGKALNVSGIPDRKGKERTLRRREKLGEAASFHKEPDGVAHVHRAGELVLEAEEVRDGDVLCPQLCRQVLLGIKECWEDLERFKRCTCHRSRGCCHEREQTTTSGPCQQARCRAVPGVIEHGRVLC